MPKKSSWGVSEKVQEARDRKQQGKVEARHKEAKAKEDAYWAQHENPRTRKDSKREEEVCSGTRGRVCAPAAGAERSCSG